MSAKTLLDLAQTRASCRAFLPTPVPRETISAIIDTARQTPSWCNAQPWQLAITEPPETDRFRDALYARASSGAADTPDVPWPNSYPDIYGDRRRTCGLQLYASVGIEKSDRAASAQQMMQNFQLFGAPHVAILHAPSELGPYGALDCGGFLTLFCLAATAHGVATIPQAALTLHSTFIKDWFDIPEDRQMLCAISFGYGDPDAAINQFRTERAAPETIIEWKS